MTLKNTVTKQTILNLLAEYILNEFGPNTATQITVIDQGNFFVVLGCTNTKKSIKLTDLFKVFSNKYSVLLSEADYPKELSLVNFIRISQEEDLVTSCNIKLYNTIRPGLISNIPESNLRDIEAHNLLSSKFPHGYGLKTNRALLMYFEYIAHNIMEGTHTTDMLISYHKYNDFENKLQIKASSLRTNEKLMSTILDLFDLDYATFVNEYQDYDFTKEVLEPTNNNPWIKKEIDAIDLLI